MNYINVFNGVIAGAETSIPGLTITNCGGPQSVTVDTSILTHYTLSPGNSELEIRPPPESGFEEITLYSRDWDWLFTRCPESKPDYRRS